MGNKLKKKPAVIDPVHTSTEVAGSPIKKTDGRSVARKKEPVSETRDTVPTFVDVVNAETARVLRDADAGKNLLDYASLEDMFKDLGM